MKKQREISVFSLSFIDVFCCALGAMILIFVINSQYLNDTVNSAVEKYRQKSKEAKKERDLARQSREEAKIARDRANEARNIAESAEKEALRSKYMAEKSKQEALSKANLATVALRKAEVAKQQAQIAMDTLTKEQERAKVTNRSLREKNDLLEETNQTLEKITQQKNVQNKELKKLITQYEKLKKMYESSQKSKNDLSSDVNTISTKNKKLQAELERIEEDKKRAKELLEKTKNTSEKAEEENQMLLSRLQKKEEQLRTIEQQIKNREEEIKQKEDAIETLEETLKKKGDKSLFGIKLNYKRIVFLLDKSGSIISNSWKKVIIDTCEEVLLHCEVDEFSVVAFSSNMKFYPRKKGLMASGDTKNKNRAMNWLKKKLRFGGATYVHEALQIAYEDYGNLDAIFLLTDGLPYEPGKSSVELQDQILEYIKKQKEAGHNTKIVTIAIGYPPTQDGEKKDTQYSDIYKYLHRISELTDGQYVGR